MSKIKINLASGAVMEKPLVTCFKGTNGNYVVLDNEANGSMGLPIIIISKLNGNSLEKIIDPNEWGAVKDNLKTIIGGTALPYLIVPEMVSAPDDFFTQLTLPVASYDLLKRVYAPVVETPAPAQTPAAPATPEPAPVPETPAAPVVPTPIEVAPIAAPEVPTTPEVPAVPAASTPIIEAPVIEPTPAPAAPEMPTAPVTPEVPSVPETPVVPVPEPAPAPVAAPEIPVTPASAPASSAPAIDLPVNNTEEGSTDATASNPDIALIKETFMKSCENMFDALIKKFQK